MKVEIKVPSMGESIVEAIVGQQLKPSGSKVEMDDELLELETDKVNQVIYSPKKGVVSWHVKTGDSVVIGQVLGVVDSEAQEGAEKTQGAKTDDGTSEVKEAKETGLPTKMEQQLQPLAVLGQKQQQEEQAKKQEGSLRFGADELVDKIRHEAGAAKGNAANPIAPAKLPEDKQAAFAKEKNRSETRKKMPKIRQVIAKRLVDAQHECAMLTTFNEVDMTRLIELRAAYKEQFAKTHGVKLGMMSFFVKASVAALQKEPSFNSYIDQGELVQRHYYDIAIAVGTDKGLVVPVVRSCDTLSFAEIEKAIADYAIRAKQNQLALEELQGGGFTITNGGVYGSLLSTPLINMPQCAILGMHTIQKRAVVIDDKIEIRPMMYLALSYDHRLVDGKQAVTFLIHIKQMIEEPSRLLFGL